MPKADKRVLVDLGPRTYSIEINKGLLAGAGRFIQAVSNAKRLAVISDETVAGLHLKTLLAGLDGYGYDIETIVLPSGESTKSYDSLRLVLDQLLAFNLSRSDAVLAFGGGVIGDLSGFAASIVKRGCDFIQIPTTLLAQVDSSVGGKTAINVKAGKNLVGSFYQPKLVLADLDVLGTLAPRELKAGYAEVLKYGLIKDRAFFDWLNENAGRVLAKDPQALGTTIAKSCAAKAALVRADEREHGVRALLNLGHTFGHALEGIAAYDGSLLHGEAVSAGMLMAFEYASEIKACPLPDTNAVRAHLKANDMMNFEKFAKGRMLSADQLMGFMMRDKKNSGDMLTLILPRAIGDAYIEKSADQNQVYAYLDRLCKKANS